MASAGLNQILGLPGKSYKIPGKFLLASRVMQRGLRANWVQISKAE